MRAKLPDAEGRVEREGVSLHWKSYGRGPDTIVFLPPWSIVHSRIYKAQLPWFSERFRCIAYDPRGNGRSDRPLDAKAYTLDVHVADALAVMDACGVGKAVLIGLSFGGMVASVLAAYHPDRVRAAILIDTAAGIGPAYPYMAPAHFLAHRERHEGWDKYNRDHWRVNYPDFADFFIASIHSDPHSSRQIEDGLAWALETTGEVLARTVEGRAIPPGFDTGEVMYRRISCPLLIIHGEDDRIQPLGRAQAVAELTGAELVTIPGSGHNPLGRYPALCNTLMAQFLSRTLDLPRPTPPLARSGRKRALYISSPIGLGHARRDIAIARELRALHPEVEIDWLAQDPVTRLLAAHGERVHPLSARLASESRHIELEAGEHELHAFQAIRRMDEVLVANFMLFQDAVEEGCYGLVIADEAWEIDHYWHEHPQLKRAKLAWLTDFVGYLPMPSGAEAEAALVADYNAEMIEHVERHPGVRDAAIFIGDPEDIVPRTFGPGLPAMREWVPRHFNFAGYVIGRHPSEFGPREDLRQLLGFRPDERICLVAVGGSAVGTHLLRRAIDSMSLLRSQIPELRMIVVCGPRIDPATLPLQPGVEFRAFVADLDRHLAACDIAIVQGGLTTCMELTAAGTPFLYFPLRNHFEQVFHVAHRLDRYGAGKRMDFATADPQAIADALIDFLRNPPATQLVTTGGAVRAARLIAGIL